jgi:hypothetical protein
MYQNDSECRTVTATIQRKDRWKGIENETAYISDGFDFSSDGTSL